MLGYLRVAETLTTDPIRPDTRDHEALAGLTRVLIRALRSMGERGDPETASRFAAQAWVVVRNSHRADAEHLAGVLHYLARLHITDTADDSAKERPMSATDQVLDVRAEVPARRHELIYETYATLGSGAGFVLVNDHDPKPLYYQFAAEHAGEFTWDYIEQGPEVWRVRIGRPDAGA